MLNQCQFIGHLGRDPDIRSMQNGDRVCNLSLACTEKWRDRNSGERKERTEWIRIVVFGKLVDIVEKYLAKGSKIFVSGKLATRKWQDQNGNDRYSTEVVLSGFDGKLVMLDGPRSQDSGGHESYEGNPNLPDPAGRGPMDDDSEVPF